MSVLEQFFQISMVFLLVTFGINMMLTTFGEPMTGQLPGIKFPDYNATSVQTASTYPSSVLQTSTAATDLSTTIATTLLGSVLTNLYNFAFGLQIIIYKICEGYGPEGVLIVFANALNLMITTIQAFGSIYLGVSLFAILRGSGGTP